jgi:hypothetical protein
MVSQYSAWATAENPNLTAFDLGINVQLIDDLPENVRSYVYRLYSSEEAYSHLQHDMIRRSSADQSVEARLGSAIGLRDTHYDGLEAIVLDWHFSEPDAEVRGYLLDHIVRQGAKSTIYRGIAMEIFGSAPKDGSKRQRMEASSAGGPLYQEFKRVIHEEDEGLFSTRRTNVTNNTFNNFGSVQGQTSLSGSAVNSGSQTNQAVVGVTEQARQLLGQARETIEQLPVDLPVKAEVTAAIADAEAEPSKDKVDRVLAGLKKVEQATGSLAHTAGSVAKLASLAGVLSSLF